MGHVMASMASSGVRPRAAQIDCWWYPGDGHKTSNSFLCGSDWVLPTEFYPGGMAGVRQRVGTPLMLYLPTVCAGGGRWVGKYNWSDTEDQGWVLPVSDELEPFFGELFDYGIATSTPTSHQSDPWPGVWAPPMLKAGWANTHMSGYETDFFSDLERQTPEARTVHGKGQMLLQAMDTAATARNITVQICGGTVPDFLKSLTLPSITNARATTDYDGEAKGHTVDSFRNFAAPDNAWPFWGTRMGVSKDNFWYATAAPFCECCRPLQHYLAANIGNAACVCAVL